MSGESLLRQHTLLQEGVSCALATLYAIDAGCMFQSLPAAEEDRDRHNHGSWMLAMLEDHLRSLQCKVDALAREASTLPQMGKAA